MQAYDIFMIAVLTIATVFGAMKGLAWQIASLTSIVASYFVSLRFSERVAPLFHAQAPWNRFLAMLVLYVLSSLAVWLLFRVVAGAIDRVKLKDFDRQIGALFGAVKGVLLCVAITFFAVTLSANAREAVLKSKSGTYIAKLLDKADGVMPAELHEVLDPYMDKLERGLDPNEPNGATADEADDLRDRFRRSATDAVSRSVEDSWNRQFSAPEAGEALPDARRFGSGFARDAANRSSDSDDEEPPLRRRAESSSARFRSGDRFER